MSGQRRFLAIAVVARRARPAQDRHGEPYPLGRSRRRAHSRQNKAEERMAMQVMSVTGPIAAEDLGRTLVHEHIVISMPGEELDPLYAPDREAIVRIAVERLQELYSHGV